MMQSGPKTDPDLSSPAGPLPGEEIGSLLVPPGARNASDGAFEGMTGIAQPEAPIGSLSLDAVLSPYVIVFCVAFVVAYFFTPIMRTIAVAYGIVDLPDPQRKIHSKPVAYLGGVAVFLGFIAGLAICQRFSENHYPGTDGLVKIPLAIIGASCLIVGLGLLDDLIHIRPRFKIIGEIAAASLLLIFGIGTNLTDQLVFYAFAWLDQHLGIEVPAGFEQALAFVTSAALVIALVVFCCNASNLMDGLDGLCGGITAIIALGLIALAAHLAMTGPPGRAADDAVRLVLAIALLGAVLGFLPFNFNPASIFMGDTGSLLMGFVVATMIILLGEAGAKWMMGALVMFSLPVLDTALAFARRYVNKRPFFAADKHHFHHQIVGRGLSIRRAVILSYGLTIFFVAAGALLVFLRTRYAVAFYLVLFGSIVVAAFKMGMVHERPRRAAEGRDGADFEPENVEAGDLAPDEDVPPPPRRNPAPALLHAE
jgi:UDP-GlcNAc:undecaprenyl-phosphate GlcNAc-1-phosphate transferase